MIRRCVYCVPSHELGEVPPFEDLSFMDGMCPAAARREHAKMDALFGPDPADLPADLSFFAPDIVERRRPGNELTTDANLM